MISIGFAVAIAWVCFVLGFFLSAVLTNTKTWEESPRIKS